MVGTWTLESDRPDTSDVILLALSLGSCVILGKLTSLGFLIYKMRMTPTSQNWYKNEMRQQK